jgi:hypothetical protein
MHQIMQATKNSDSFNPRPSTQLCEQGTAVIYDFFKSNFQQGNRKIF